MLVLAIIHCRVQHTGHRPRHDECLFFSLSLLTMWVELRLCVLDTGTD
jgi:hypothetical protein